MKITYSHLQSYFTEPLPGVEDVCRTFTFGAFEIEGVDDVEVGGKKEQVIDVKVLPNRAHDCLSWVGIAREYAALTGRTMKNDPFLAPLPTFGDAKKNEGKTKTVSLGNSSPDASQGEAFRGKELRLETADPSLNPAHTLSYIRGVKVAPSPAWLREALEAVGQRSINNVVDATNYVMLEYGQPTHAFDAAQFATKELDGVQVRGVRIRHARDGEKITLLGGKELTLTPHTQVLSDAISGDALDIAGVKGGIHAELGDDTTEIIITSGKYNAANIRKTTHAVGIRTDASKRFENEIPHLLPWYGQQRVQQLILEVAGGEVVETAAVDNAPEQTRSQRVSVLLDRVRGTLGSNISDTVILDTLARLSLSPSVDNGVVAVTPPWWRLDVEMPEDVVEEVGRVVGYDSVPATPLPTGRVDVQPNQLVIAIDRVRQVLRDAGFWELSTYSLRDSGDIELANALAADKGWLRKDLASGMHDALSQNEFHAPGVGVYDCLKLFEVGHVFTLENGERKAKTVSLGNSSPDHVTTWFRESTHVCIGARYLTGKKREERTNALLLEMKAKLQEALGIHIDHRVDKETLEFNLEVAIEGKEFTPPAHLPVVPYMRYTPLSHFPVALRDVACWVHEGQILEPRAESLDSAQHQGAQQRLEGIIRAAAGPLLHRIDLFDTFSKEGKTSYAFHLGFQSYEKTLTDDNLVPTMQAVYEALKVAGCEIR